MIFTKESLKIDAAAESDRIASLARETLRKQLRRNGFVVGVSGGVDSAVSLALCVRAVGRDRVKAILLPEKESSPESEALGFELAAHYGVEPVRENLTAALEGVGCYRRRDEAIARLFPGYDAALGYKSKITLPAKLLDEDTLNVFSLTIIGPTGAMETKPLPTAEFLEIAGASNFKQRIRMAMLYYHAEVNHYAVAGTANKNEHDQGFFVKYGDGGVDVKLIEHLYKTQVYQLAEHLGVPEGIRRRTPTTDTYSAPATQEEFFFRLPFETMDLLWWAMENSVPIGEVARVMNLSVEQVLRAYGDFERKRRTTEYLRLAPVRLAESQAAAAQAGMLER
ncbi:MAG TPA: NAD(+) synthase [Bryobacteraceae bacterium]|jgi:NAD+ synthase|nr:NAD(+) synthase [Bryobacteraceae bacterium]